MDKFFTTHYEQIIKMTEKITQSSNYEEIAHYAMEQFMIHPKRDQLIKRGEAMKFLSGIIWRNYHSSTSPYHKLYRQNSRIFPYDPSHFIDTPNGKDDSDLDQDQLRFQNFNETRFKSKLQDREDNDYDHDKDMKINAINGILEDMEGEGIHYWYISTLFKMWVEQPNYSELSRQTLIPRTSIAEAVEEARIYIKQKLRDNGIID